MPSPLQFPKTIFPSSYFPPKKINLTIQMPISPMNLLARVSIHPSNPDKSKLLEGGGQEVFYFKTFDPSLMVNKYRTRMNECVFDIAKATRIIQHSEKFTWKHLSV